MKKKRFKLHINVTRENIKKLQFFDTTRDLAFEDGSIIKKGTNFMIEGELLNEKYEVHFCAEEENIYRNETGEGYEFTLEEILSFSIPSQYSIWYYIKEQMKKFTYNQYIICGIHKTC